VFIFNLRAEACNQTYLHGLTLSLNEMLNNNPDWSYRLLCHDGCSQERPHLTVLDFTDYESLEQVAPNENALLKKENGCRLLLLVNTDNKRLIEQLSEHYACSLLGVDERSFQIRDIVDASLRKHRYISPSVQQALKRQHVPENPIRLTSTEKKVLECMRNGKNGVQIAQHLFRSQKTISSHKRNIMKKLGVKDDFHLNVIMLDGVDYN
jgi:DNA-binding NarL/FixJ family response regulator